MNVRLERSDFFRTDFDLQYRWYLAEAGEEVAERYLAAVETTLESLLANPRIGRPREFRAPSLSRLRSFRVASPFGSHLIFYREIENAVVIERVMHGARDLPRRLIEPPGAE